jgi:hypothetical protein
MTAPATTPADPPTARTPAVHTHPCARCGAPVALDVGLCERCNPIGLRDSASSQVHGSVFLAVGLAVVALAVLAHLAVSGVGPFPAEVGQVRSENGALTVSITVTNEGTSSGSTSCRISDPATRGGGGSVYVQTPRIAGGESVTIEQPLVGLGTLVRPFAVECSAP